MTALTLCIIVTAAVSTAATALATLAKALTCKAASELADTGNS